MSGEARWREPHHLPLPRHQLWEQGGVHGGGAAGQHLQQFPQWTQPGSGRPGDGVRAATGFLRWSGGPCLSSLLQCAPVSPGLGLEATQQCPAGRALESLQLLQSTDRPGGWRENEGLKHMLGQTLYRCTYLLLATADTQR